MTDRARRGYAMPTLYRDLASGMGRAPVSRDCCSLTAAPLRVGVELCPTCVWFGRFGAAGTSLPRTSLLMSVSRGSMLVG